MLHASHLSHSRLAAFLLSGVLVLGFAKPVSAGAGIEFGPTVELGDTLGGTFADTLDWNSYTNAGWEFGVVTSVREVSPDLPVGVEIYNSALDAYVSYETRTMGVSASDAFLPLTFLGVQPGFSYTEVGGVQFTWNGSGSIRAVLTYMAARNTNTSDLLYLSPLWSGAFVIDESATTAAYTQTGAPDAVFVARAPGGTEFRTANSGNAGARINPGAPDWSVLSDSNAKTDICTVDHHETLRKLSELPVTSWQYKHDPDRRYLGPMAQDFHAAFGLGDDHTRISTIDTDGVTVSALKGLIAELQDRKARSAAQAKRLAELEAELQTLSEKLHRSLPSAE